MAVKIYNTLSLKKEIFKPIKKGKVGMYTCGPTVYDFAHIGNLRTYIFEDILRRVLKFNDYQVKQAMNITDIEDKIIKKAQAEGKDIYTVTKPYTKIFFEDLKKLNIEKVEFYPKATGHIKEMIDITKKLLTKRIAYRGEDGSIYFSIKKFKNYGKLSQLKKREIKIGARISADEYNKKQARDFVLWKSAKPNEPSWPSPWTSPGHPRGKGRPGWHIECSAMSMKYLGKTLDIHAGAVDLIFPHHENEIAQSEGATGKTFSKYWVHGEHLLVDGQKMSKSLGNIFTLRDLENKKINLLAFRYLILTSHYRSKLNFTWKSLEAAEKGLENLYNQLSAFSLPDGKAGFQLSANKKVDKKFKEKFLDAINDDLNTPKALAIVQELLKSRLTTDYSKLTTILDFDKVLGLKLKDAFKSKTKQAKTPKEIVALAEKREQARKAKNWAEADKLREKIRQKGYEVEDTAKGVLLYPYVAGEKR
ncbi:MAG: cysteine--tRNA ligase [Candidatus Paceibacterota bacterium]